CVHVRTLPKPREVGHAPKPRSRSRAGSSGPGPQRLRAQQPTDSGTPTTAIIGRPRPNSQEKYRPKAKFLKPPRTAMLPDRGTRPQLSSASIFDSSFLSFLSSFFSFGASFFSTFLSLTARPIALASAGFSSFTSLIDPPTWSV